MTTMEERLEAQNREFAAASELAYALRSHDHVAVVDDAYPRVRAEYERCLANLMKAMKANGRFEPGNSYGLL